MSTVMVGSGEGHLRLSAVEWPGEGETRRLFLEAELHVPGELWVEGMSAVRVIIPRGRDLGGLVEFFAGVAGGWQELGMSEGPVWSSFGRELEIEARRVRPAGSAEHRGPDYVMLHVMLRDVRAWEHDRFIATGKLAIQPAGRLHDIAREVRALAGALG